MKCEGYDQYQVMLDGSRRLTRRNRKFLKPFTPYKPDRMVINTSVDAQVRRVPDNVQQKVIPEQQTRAQQQMQQHPQQDMPQQQVRPQQRQQRQDDQQQQGGPQDRVQQHMGFQYLPLSAAPARGTFTEAMDSWIPTEVQPQQDAADHGNGDGQAKDTQDDDGVRRSSRQGRGQTSKYKDYVQSVSYRDKYEQEWPVLGRRGASLVVT